MGHVGRGLLRIGCRSSAEMSFAWSAMVSDAGAGGVAGVRRVGGVSASMYLLTVSLWMSIFLAIRQMDIP